MLIGLNPFLELDTFGRYQGKFPVCGVFSRLDPAHQRVFTLFFVDTTTVSCDGYGNIFFIAECIYCVYLNPFFLHYI